MPNFNTLENYIAEIFNVGCFSDLLALYPLLDTVTMGLPYVNLSHGKSYYILSVFGVLENEVFIPSFSFFDFTRTMFSSLLSTLYISNTSTN